MELCASGHEEICFSGEVCPLCKEIAARIRKEEELSDAEDQIINLKDKLESICAKD